MVQYASSKKIYSSHLQMVIFKWENCQKTIESGLKNLIISLDGNSQETYESYRKRRLQKVIEGTKTLFNGRKNLKVNTHIILQFLVVRDNEHLVNEMKQLCKDLELDEFRIKTAQFYDFKMEIHLCPIMKNTPDIRKINMGITS